MLTKRMRELIADPTVSYWLKNSIAELANRDAVDAVNDAELLVELVKERLAILLEAAGPGPYLPGLEPERAA